MIINGLNKVWKNKNKNVCCESGSNGAFTVASVQKTVHVLSTRGSYLKAQVVPTLSPMFV